MPSPAPASTAPIPTDWPALAAAQARDDTARVPFFIVHGGRSRRAGSVAKAHLPALARWPQALHIGRAGVTLRLPAAERVPFFESANRLLHAAGLIVAWRNETYPVLCPQTGQLLATLERAASRFWGTATFGAHCNGYVADAQGRPTHLWIARRSYSKAVDPGLLDNLIGGGVPHGQTPAECVVREGWEEAGLQAEQMAGMKAGRVFRVARDIPEGFQLEHVSVFDLALPASLQPQNQDGEVHSVTLMPVAQALAHAAAGDLTVDASLVTLDFALRHQLLDATQHQRLEAAMAGLWVVQ